MKKIIVTGATSMLGIALIEQALVHGVEKIFAIIRPNSMNRTRIPKDERIDIIECDLDCYDRLAKIISEKCDVFFHLAWRKTGELRNKDVLAQENNIRYTLAALNAAHMLGCSKFIGTGSQAEYGILDLEHIAPDSPTNPITPYGIAKYAAGKLAMEAAKHMGIDCIWVRVFSVYGENDKDSTMISSTISKLRQGERPKFTPAEQRWDYLYSSDAGKALYMVADKCEGHKVYCLGSGTARPLYEYISIINDMLSNKNDIGIGEVPYPPNCVMNLCADITNLTKDTGWKPTVCFEEGIKRILQFIN